uniref:SFRICE_018900 n=1 Tax=Spodoptera frugiperda TaxID=7108 RepID=A0A2H1V1M0_SPOFR
MYHLMVSNRRRLWTLETPEALQVRCRPFGGYEFKGCWGIWEWYGGNWASSNLTHSFIYGEICLWFKKSIIPHGRNIDSSCARGQGDADHETACHSVISQSITLHPTLFKTQLPVAYPYLRLARLFRVTISGHRKCGPADGEQRPWKPMKSTTGAPSQGGGDAGNGTTGAGAEGGDSTPAGDGGTPGEGGATGETTPAGGGGDAADPTTPEPE